MIVNSLMVSPVRILLCPLSDALILLQYPGHIQNFDPSWVRVEVTVDTDVSEGILGNFSNSMVIVSEYGTREGA